MADVLQCEMEPFKAFKLEPEVEEVIEVTPDIIKLEFEPHSCFECGICCSSEMELERHKRDHPPDKRRFACYACNKFYSSQMNLNIHLSSKVHEPKKRFHCGHCQKRFSLKLYLQRHKLIHLRSGSLVKCQDCWRKFYRVSDLLVHQKKHRKRFECTTCLRAFVSLYLLHTHKCGKLFTCFCKKTFQSQSTYKNHKEMHLNEKSLQCHICGKNFTVPRFLKSHLDLHMKIADSVVCDVCFKKFSRMSCLKNHKKTHTRVQCDVCQKVFNCKTDQLNHQREHRKTFPCDVCGRSYRSQYCLKRHQKTHNRPEFLGCEYCDRQFRYKYLLDRHMESGHSDKTIFSCEECGKDFHRRRDLELHTKVHDKIKDLSDDIPGLLGYLNYVY